MRPFSRSLLPLLALVVLAMAGGCRGDGDDSALLGDLDAEQVLNVSLTAEPDTLDPQRATDILSVTVLRNIYSTLLRIDENLDIQPDLAQQVPTVGNGGISEDGLTYTFQLRHDLRWSDGTKLVAQDFVNGANRLFEPGRGNNYVDFYRVLAAARFNVELEKFLGEMDAESEADQKKLTELENSVVANLQVSAPDDRTVVYELNRRSPVFLLLATMWPLYPVRQDLVNQHGNGWTEAGNLIGNGPFVLTEWNYAENIVLTRNDSYHGEAPILETINIDMIGDTNIAFLAYRQGELDIVALGPAELVQVRGSDLEQEFRAYAGLNTIGILINIDDPILSEVKVRQALAGAFDREEYAEIVREGAVLPAYAWVPPGMPGHDPEAGRQYQDAVERSRQLLEEAGHPGGQGIEIEIEILTADASTSRLSSEWLKEQWENNLGVSVSINVLEIASYFAAHNAGDYQVVTGGWGADYADPQNWLPLFRTGGLLNSGNFSDAEFDRLLAAADEELDNEQRINLYRQAQVRLLEQMPFARLYYGHHNILVKPWVQELITSPMEGEIPGDRFFDRTSIRGRQ